MNNHDERGETAGLRAFALDVEAYAGVSYPERPERVTIDGERFAVTDVLASWREDTRVGFRVRLEGGQLLLLYYVPELDLWSGCPFRPTPGRASRRKA